MASTSAYHLTCLCGRVREPGTLLHSDTIPVISPELCHCNPCRYTTGALCGSFPKLRAAPSQTSLDNCVEYASSSTHSRYHCRTCGCSTFVDDKEKEGWFFCAGMLEATEGGGSRDVKDVVRVERHDFLGDTGDGGLVPRLMRLGGREPVRWDTFPDTRKVSEEEVLEMQRVSIEKGKTKPAVDETLQAKCHCGGVDLRVKRADYAKDTQGVDQEDIPADKEKYVAHFCVCRSCRLSTGQSLMPWCFIPPKNIIVIATGEPIKLGEASEQPGANGGTALKHFKSSSDVHRYFCGTCGATVFFHYENPDHHVVDLAVGLLRAEEGIMARKWLDWMWGRVSWKEEMQDCDVLEAILGDEGKQSIEKYESSG